MREIIVNQKSLVKQQILSGQKADDLSGNLALKDSVSQAGMTDPIEGVNSDNVANHTVASNFYQNQSVIQDPLSDSNMISQGVSLIKALDGGTEDSAVEDSPIIEEKPRAIGGKRYLAKKR